MVEGTDSRRAVTLAGRLHEAPLGILVIAALLTITGLAATAGGIYLLAADADLSPWAGATALVTGPAILYLSYHLVQLARWAWLALAVVVGLLLVSSLLRIAVAPSVPIAALGEIVAEVALGVYLARPGLRVAFGWR